MQQENNARPLESSDPEFLYLYGRALLLSNHHEEASRAFKLALDKLKDRPSRDPLKVEAKMAAAVAALRSNSQASIQAAAKELEEVIEMVNKSASTPPANLNGPVGVSDGGASATPPQQ